MRLPTPQPDWSETLRCAYNYFVMGSTDEPPARLVASNVWPPRDRDAFYIYRHQYRERVARVVGEIVKRRPPPATLLDIGAAQGAVTLPLAKRGYRITLNDLREEVFEFVDLIREPGEDYRRVVGDFFATDFAEKFDVVLASEIIEHVAHPDRFLARCANLVKPDGFVVITTPNGNWIRNRLKRFSDFTEEQRVALEAGQFKPDADGHIFALRRDEISQLTAAAGLRLVHVGYVTPSVKLERLPLGKQIARAPIVNKHLHSTVLFVSTPS